MARTVGEFPPSERSTIGSKYPFDQWFNGQVWELQKGVDFTCEPRSLAIRFTKEAANRGIRVQTTVRDHLLYVQKI